MDRDLIKILSEELRETRKLAGADKTPAGGHGENTGSHDRGSDRNDFCRCDRKPGNGFVGTGDPHTNPGERRRLPETTPVEKIIGAKT